MERIDLKHLNFQIFQDTDIISAFNWFKSYMKESTWKNRINKIEENLSFEVNNSSTNLNESGKRLLIEKDRIGWYLYLIHTIINEPQKYEYYQGARILPIFKRIGMSMNYIEKIVGLDKRVKDLLYKRTSEADSLLFEILVALLWSRNGYNVKFLEEQLNAKTPDLEVEKDGVFYNIECKRQSKTSEYTYKETAKRLDMLSMISDILIQNNILADITFIQEFIELPSDYLQTIINQEFIDNFISKEFVNENVIIKLSRIDLFPINKHLESYFVKSGSPMLNYLIGGKILNEKSFTCGLYSNQFRVGEGNVNNIYISEIRNCYGVFWNSISEKAINSKARDVKSFIKTAISQFDLQKRSIIHIGLETYDGALVEQRRNEKIINSVEDITESKNLDWIFLHYFQSYSSKDEDWIFDETVSSITNIIIPKYPITTKMLIVPDEDNIQNGLSHWDIGI